MKRPRIWTSSSTTKTCGRFDMEPAFRPISGEMTPDISKNVREDAFRFDGGPVLLRKGRKLRKGREADSGAKWPGGVRQLWQSAASRKLSAVSRIHHFAGGGD